MGTATNQIATEKDLYYSGFTNFASSGPSATMGVTYGDIWTRTESTSLTKGLKIFEILPKNYLSGSTNVSSPAGSGTFVNIAQYDLSQINNLDEVTIGGAFNAPLSVSIKNTGSSIITATLHLSYGNNEKTISYSISSGTTKTITSCLHSILGLSYDFSTSIFKGCSTLSWQVEIKNSSSSSSATVTNNYTQTQMWIKAHTSQQLIKYSNIGGKDNPVNIPWTIKISENVVSSTQANTIEFIYKMLYLGEQNGQRVKIFESIPLRTFALNNGNNISGSAEETVYIDINPHSIKKNSENKDKLIYGSWLEIKCGTTKNRQTWTCKLRTASTSSSNTGTWDSSFSDEILTCVSFGGTSSADDPNSAKFVYAIIGGGQDKAIESFDNNNPPTYSDEQFLKDVKKYNGIEFHIE